MNYFLPVTDVPPVGVPDPKLRENLFDATAIPGIVKFKDIASLDTLLNAMITKNNGNGAVSAEKDLPSPTAHIDYLDRLLKRDAININTEDESFLAWQGVLALFGLQKRMGFCLRIREMNIQAAPLRDVFYQELHHQGLVESGHDGGAAFERVYVLEKRYYNALGAECWEHIALVGRELLLCPFKCIKPEALSDVPWGREGRWISPAVVDRIFLTDSNRYALFRWLNDISQVVSNAVRHGIEAMTAQLGNPAAVPYKASSVGLNKVDAIANNGKAAGVQIDSVPVYSVEIPSEEKFFSAKLVETLGDRIGDLCAGSGAGFCTGTGTQGGLPALTLLPLSRNGIAFVQDPNVDLISVRIEGTDGGIRAVLQVTVDGDTKTFRKVYGRDDIVKIANFPILSLWPNCRFIDVHGKEAWHRYYLAIGDNEAVVSTDPGFLDLDLDSLPERRGSLSIDNGTYCKVEFHNETCKVASFDSFPEFVHYQMGGIDCGCVFIRKPKAVNLDGGIAAEAAIDYGTSNTVCVLKIGPNKVPVVNFFSGQDIRDLCASGKRLDNDYKKLHNTLWLSNGADPMPKIKTLAVLNRVEGGDRALEETDGIVDGRMLAVNNNALVLLLDDKHNFVNRVYANTKFADLESNDPQEKAAARAACLAEQELVLRCALEAMKKEAGALRLHFSYPNQQVRANMSGYWEQAVGFVNGVTAEGYAVNPKQINMMEAEASARYVIAGKPDGFGGRTGSAPSGDFAVIDIGGGTTDISLWTLEGTAAAAKKLDSLRYAGNEMVSASLVGAYRLQKGANYDNIFFHALDQNTKAAIASAGFGSDLSAVMNSVVSDINTGVFNDPNSLLKAMGKTILYAKILVRARLCIMFYYLTALIRDAGYDFSCYTDIDRFYLYFAGGGAQALELAKDMNGGVDRFAQYLRSRLSEELGGAAPSVTSTVGATHAAGADHVIVGNPAGGAGSAVSPDTFVFDIPDNTDKLEVVHGMLFQNPVVEDRIKVEIPQNDPDPAAQLLAAPASAAAARALDLNECENAYRELVNNWMQDGRLLPWNNGQTLRQIMLSFDTKGNWGNVLQGAADARLAAMRMAELCLKSISRLG